MSVAGAQAAEVMAQARKLALFSSWGIPPGTYHPKNCVVVACECGSETFVLKRHHPAGYTCSNCRAKKNA